MEKPDGLVALPLDILPEALRQLTLRDLPGIGSRMEKRLNEQGIQTMDQLLALDCEQAGEVWGSVLGRAAVATGSGARTSTWTETEHLKSMSHQHVLAPGDAHPGEGLGGGAQAAAQGGHAAARERLVGQQHRPGHRLCRAAQ